MTLIHLIAARYSQLSGKSLQEAYREIGDQFRGIKVKHTGERPPCRICGNLTLCGSTVRSDGVVERYYKCPNCQTPLKTYEEIPPEDVVKPTDPLLAEQAKPIIREEGPRKRSPRKRKR